MGERIIINTRRLHIREFRQDDVESVHSWAEISEVCRFMEWGPNCLEDTKNYIAQVIGYQQQEDRRNFDVAVSLSDGRVIGSIGITVENPSHRVGVLGYCYHPHYWGKGYATEAGAAILNFGFEQLELMRIYATCDVKNRGSARVLEKIGMEREGKMRSHRLIRGEWRDSYLYAIIASDKRIPE